MRRPMGLGTEGRRAWDAALKAIENDEKYEQAAVRYAEAVDLASRAKRAWVKQHRPMVTVGTNGTIGKSPYLRVWEDAKAEVARAGAALGLDPGAHVTKKNGRPLGGGGAKKSAPPVLKLAKRKDEDTG